MKEQYLYEIRYNQKTAIGTLSGRCWYTTREEAASIAEELAYNDNGCEVLLIKEHRLPFKVDDVIELAIWLDDNADWESCPITYDRPDKADKPISQKGAIG